MTTIVFSKDRAMQLQAFLRSYEKHVSPLGSVDVFYASTSKRHEAAYQEVFILFPWARPRWQIPFKDGLLSLLSNADRVIFFCDDQIFIRPWDGAGLPGLSLRMAPHLTRCYTMNLPQSVPELQSAGDMRTWRWADGALDWRYPLSIDGHVLAVRDLREMLDAVSFHSPNSMEAELQVFLPTFLGRRGACYELSKVVNVPWNRVQTECANRFGTGPTPDEMLDLWEAGKQIDLSHVYGVINESVHQEFEFRMEAR